MAEDIFKELDDLKPGVHNLVELESFIAEIADCIILFPESAGSIAELGFFSNSATLRTKLLIANNVSLQSEDSFIALGPISLVDRDSRFKPTIQLTYKNGDPEFHFIHDRLKYRFKGKSRKLLKTTSYAQLSILEKFFRDI